MTHDEFQLVRYHRSDQDAVFELLRQALPAADSIRLIRQWDWKYEANPFNGNDGPFLMLLKTKRQLVGVYGRLFFRIAVDGREYCAHHGCDLVVHPAYRGQGLSARLRARDLTDSAIHFSWQNGASYRVARRDGTAGVPYVPLFRPLDVAQVVRRIMGANRLGRAVGAMAGAALQHVPRLRRPRVGPNVAVSEIRSFDERFDRLWQRACRDRPVMLVRDRRYLDWRFARRPDARYMIVAASRDSEVIGYMVTRCVDRAGDRWGYLVDFLVQHGSPVLFAVLLEHAMAGLRQAGAIVVSSRVVMPPYRRMLYRHGFLRSPLGAGGYIRGRIRLPSPAAQVHRDVRQWFLTMGDGDLEMSF